MSETTESTPSGPGVAITIVIDPSGVGVYHRRGCAGAAGGREPMDLTLTEWQLQRQRDDVDQYRHRCRFHDCLDEDGEGAAEGDEVES